MDQKKIGSFLKKLRLEKGLTQMKLAEQLNISNRSISRWETGSTLPDISILMELAEFYEVDIKEIIDGERKSENMNEETKKVLDSVVDYTSKDKEMILEKTQKYSAIASVTLLTGMILAVIESMGSFQEVFSFRETIEILFGSTLILVVAIWLLCSGKVAEMKKEKSRSTAFLVVLAVIIIMAVVVLEVVGVIQ